MLIKTDIYDRMNNASDKFKSSTFIDNVFCVLREDGNDLNYGEFISKVYAKGIIHVLKALGLYKVKGRGSSKSVFVHPKIKLVIDTTLLSSKDIAHNIIMLVDGHYCGIPKITCSDLDAYNILPMSPAKRDLGNYGTYIMYSKHSGFYKIGRSKDVYSRVKGLCYSLGEDIEIVAVCENDHESAIHFLYKLRRMIGEWFDLSKKEVADIITVYGFVSFK